MEGYWSMCSYVLFVYGLILVKIYRYYYIYILKKWIKMCLFVGWLKVIFVYVYVYLIGVFILVEKVGVSLIFFGIILCEVFFWLGFGVVSFM